MLALGEVKVNTVCIRNVFNLSNMFHDFVVAASLTMLPRSNLLIRPELADSGISHFSF